MSDDGRSGRMDVYVPWLVLTGAATLAAAAFEASGFRGFDRFIGPLSPALTTVTAGAVSLGALAHLRGRGYWRPLRSRTVRGLIAASAATVPFAIVAIGVDLVAGFPRDVNVEWPGAWLLYPSIALVADTAFHLLPLAALAWLTGSRFSDLRFDARTWGLVLVVAAVEPAAQVVLGSTLPAFVMPHVYLIGVVQLLLLRRYGYLPMIWFRVCYYLLWHVLWGQARLELLY